MVANSLRDNVKIVITAHGNSPTLLLGSLPVESHWEREWKRRQGSERRIAKRGS
jgi:hypothetical protein